MLDNSGQPGKSCEFLTSRSISFFLLRTVAKKVFRFNDREKRERLFVLRYIAFTPLAVCFLNRILRSSVLNPINFSNNCTTGCLHRSYFLYRKIEFVSESLTETFTLSLLILIHLPHSLDRHWFKHVIPKFCSNFKTTKIWRQNAL